MTLPALRAGLAGQQAAHRQPVLDLTEFDYVAKTCRDQEILSAGPQFRGPRSSMRWWKGGRFARLNRGD